MSKTVDELLAELTPVDKKAFTQNAARDAVIARRVRLAADALNVALSEAHSVGLSCEIERDIGMARHFMMMFGHVEEEPPYAITVKLSRKL